MVKTSEYVETDPTQIIYNKMCDYIYEDLGEDTGILFGTIEEYKDSIDEPITELRDILVKDDRSVSSFYWEGVPYNKRQSLVNYTVVKGSDEDPITLRKVFKAIGQDPHYKDYDVKYQHHNCLEGYNFITPCVFEFIYGS